MLQANIPFPTFESQKKYRRVSAAIFFIFQTCFQYSLTVLLFLPHVCFLLTSNGLGILRDVPVMGCNSVIEKNLKKKLVSAIFGPQFNWRHLLPPPLLLSFLPSFFFLNPLLKICCFCLINSLGVTS